MRGSLRVTTTIRAGGAKGQRTYTASAEQRADPARKTGGPRILLPDEGPLRYRRHTAQRPQSTGNCGQLHAESNDRRNHSQVGGIDPIPPRPCDQGSKKRPGRLPGHHERPSGARRGSSTRLPLPTDDAQLEPWKAPGVHTERRRRATNSTTAVRRPRTDPGRDRTGRDRGLRTAEHTNKDRHHNRGGRSGKTAHGKRRDADGLGIRLADARIGERADVGAKRQGGRGA